jgi:hypothetical protein
VVQVASFVFSIIAFCTLRESAAYRKDPVAFHLPSTSIPCRGAKVLNKRASIKLNLSLFGSLRYPWAQGRRCAPTWKFAISPAHVHVLVAIFTLNSATLSAQCTRGNRAPIRQPESCRFGEGCRTDSLNLQPGCSFLRKSNAVLLVIPKESAFQNWLRIGGRSVTDMRSLMDV